MNNYTYTLVPEADRDVLCSHYGTQEQRNSWPVVNGYLIVDCGKCCDMAVEHPQICDAVKAHSFSQEIIDVLKGPLAHDIADSLSKAHADNNVPYDENWTTQAENDAYRADWKVSYDSVYQGHYDTAFASVVVDPVHLNQSQAIAFKRAFPIGDPI